MLSRLLSSLPSLLSPLAAVKIIWILLTSFIASASVSSTAYCCKVEFESPIDSLHLNTYSQTDSGLLVGDGQRVCVEYSALQDRHQANGSCRGCTHEIVNN